MSKFPFTEIEGYLSRQDRIDLKSLARQCSRLLPVIPPQGNGNPCGSFFEVGSYKGLSALCIMDGMPKNNRANLICFDWFEPEKHAEFMRNLSARSPDNNVGFFPIAGDFKKTADGFKHWDFAFGFIDHSHTLDDTKSAYEIFWPKILPGGVLAFHDYTNPQYQEPREFLDSLPHRRILEGSILALEK